MVSYDPYEKDGHDMAKTFQKFLKTPPKSPLDRGPQKVQILQLKGSVCDSRSDSII